MERWNKGEHHRRSHSRWRGFTLVELLVVIGIIALLIAILMPALGKARRSAQSLSCLANLRSIGQAMFTYVTESKGWLPGSANTSGRHLYPPGTLNNSSVLQYGYDNLPGGPISTSDWIAPLCRMMKINLPDSPRAVLRYDAYRQIQVFLCPANSGVLSTAYTGDGQPDAGAGQQLGYATAFAFMLTPGAPNPGVTGQTRISTGAGWPTLPGAYVPKITKVGRAGEKIFAADAGKFVNGSGTPSYNLSIAPTPNSPGRDSGPYSDFGAWTTATSSYDRTAANSGPGVDGRVFSYRHGTVGERQKLGSYRLNAVFYDGHAETLDEVTAMNPRFWLPAGTVIPDNGKIPGDVAARHVPTAPFTVP
jgi:prepilin-type N-terminal cleavage/methylation domain-containing protein